MDVMGRAQGMRAGAGSELVVRRARRVTLGYGAAAIVHDVDLDVVAGETLAIVGANGCGKTTLLRALAGLLRARAGTLTWPAGAPPSGAGMLLSQDEPVAPFRVRELVVLGLGRDGRPCAAERRRVDDALAELGLSALGDRPCAAISGGEWQRARLARALVARPSLVLLDEPTNHLDPAGRAQVVALCARVASAARALVLATHDLDLAARCDRVLLLADGVGIACGPPADVLVPVMLARALRVPVRRHILPGDDVPVFRAEVTA